MDKEAIKAQLKECLLRDVNYLCRRADRLWAEPIVRTLRDLRETETKAVFFGGTLRSLMLARLELANSRCGWKRRRPRDVDIVVDGTTIDALRERFKALVSRETRFGGLQLQRMKLHFDLWPLQSTWAFVQERCPNPAFAALPRTTFFNLEAIAADVWAEPGHTRMIYSGDDQFFDGLISQTLEVNREDNPFPSLCVVRALSMASSLRFAIGPLLARYLASHGPLISNKELEDVQRKHYGKLRFTGQALRELIDYIRNSLEIDCNSAVKLPQHNQLTFWNETGHEEKSSRFRLLTCRRFEIKSRRHTD